MSQSEKRNIEIKIRVDKTENEILESIAASMNTSKAKLIRNIAIGDLTNVEMLQNIGSLPIVKKFKEVYESNFKDMNKDYYLDVMTKDQLIQEFIEYESDRLSDEMGLEEYSKLVSKKPDYVNNIVLNKINENCKYECINKFEGNDKIIIFTIKSIKQSFYMPHSDELYESLRQR